MTDLTAFIDPHVPMDKYVRDDFDLPPTLSSSIAHRLLTRSPLHAWTAHAKLNPAWAPDDDAAFDIGVATHAVVLEGRPLTVMRDAKGVAFTDRRKKECQERRKVIIAEGGIPTLEWECEAVQEMAASVLSLFTSSPDLVGVNVLQLQAEQTIAWREGETWLRCRPDWVTPERDVIFSLKTTGNADPDAFLRGPLTAHSYDLQSAFELAAVKALTGKDAAYVYIVVEVEPPYACSLVGLEPAFREFSAGKFREAVARWAHCLAENRWPGYPDRICYLGLPPWMQAKAIERGQVAPPVDDSQRPIEEVMFEKEWNQR